MTLKSFRTKRGISPSFVAEKLGITYRQFHRNEIGEAPLPEERAKKLAKIYGVKLSKIKEVAMENGGISTRSNGNIEEN